MSIHHVWLAGLLAAAPLTAAAQQAAPTPPAGSTAAAVVMPCAQAQAVAATTIEAATARLETARQANSAAAMRAAVDDLDRLLRDVSAQLAPCAAAMQAQAPAGGAHAGHTMPTAAAAVPGAAPGSPAAHAPAAADTHAGHTTPPAASAPTTPPRAVPQTPRPRSAAPRAPAPATGGEHAGHAMPSASQPGATAGRSPQPQPGAARAPAAANASAQAAAPGGDRAVMTPSGNAVTDLAQLKCQSRVDPKTAPRMLHQGRMYYFCTEQERAAFAKDAGKQAPAPAQAAPAHAH